MGTLVAAILVVLVGSGLSSGAEAALLSVPEVRARQMAETGGTRERALWAVKQRIARPIAAIVVLNNVFNIVGSIAVGVIAAATFGQRAVGVVSGVLTFLVILFSEIIPKTLAERYAERVSLWIALPVRGLTLLLTPLVLVLETLMRPLIRGERAPITTEDEIRLLVDLGRSEGMLEDDEVAMIQRVFLLNDRVARDLMTPRTAITWLDGNRPIAEVRDEVLASEHSRLVVCDGDLDQAHGIVLRTDLFAALVEGSAQTVSEVAREILAVPWVLRADDLLQPFRDEQEHLALVVDEYGGTLGVVTLEDVIEVLTGPIIDETDRRPNLRSYARARARARLTRWNPPARRSGEHLPRS